MSRKRRRAGGMLLEPSSPLSRRTFCSCIVPAIRSEPGPCVCGLFVCHLCAYPSKSRGCSWAGPKAPEPSSRGAPISSCSRANHGQPTLFKRTHPPQIVFSLLPIHQHKVPLQEREPSRTQLVRGSVVRLQRSAE